uniref:Uncharacterized protein n=1 Tax=Rhizophora mucronata TaxID=61149 RepID=A0A2P2P4F4_RHIMU
MTRPSRSLVYRLILTLIYLVAIWIFWNPIHCFAPKF